ncbi:hypothetical protein SDJN02_00407 [Cucurbita argyrosperma subsp. argyrosperma]
MEIATEPTIPTTSTQSKPVDSEQQSETSGAGETTATPELETPINGTPDREKKGKGQDQMESSKCECKTPTPDEKTEEKQRILVPVNGLMMDRLKVPKSPNVAGEAKQRGGIALPKNGTPNRLKVPKAFKYHERYTSPTDLMMSPITKGLLARTRKGAVPSKMHELRISEMSLHS